MVVLLLPSHLLMLAARKELPSMEADLDPPFTRSGNLFAGREEYRSRVEDCRLGVGGEEFAHLILLCITELALGALNSGGASFHSFTEATGKETWDIIVSVL